MRDEAAVVEFESELNSVEPVDEVSGWRRVDDRYGNCPVVWRHAESGDEVLVFAEAPARFVVLRRPAASGVLNRMESFGSVAQAVQFVEAEVLE